MRIARVGFHIARGLLIVRFHLAAWSVSERRRAVQRWSAQLLSILAVRLVVHGRAPSEHHRPVMLVANHVAWIDIFAINAVVPARFVAKSEIRGWPLFGWLCGQTGTVFIRQTRRHDTLRVNQAISAALEAGDIFAVFPEGTTTDGSTVIKFHSALLEPALNARAAVQPVALRYTRSDGSLCDEVSYIGERSLWDTLLAVTTLPTIRLELSLLSRLNSDGGHRREIARAAEDAIRQALRR